MGDTDNDQRCRIGDTDNDQRCRIGESVSVCMRGCLATSQGSTKPAARVCVYVFVCVHGYTDTQTQTHIHTYTQTPTHPFTHSHTCLACLKPVDPSLLDDTALSGDRSLSLAQVAQCLRRMRTMASSGHAHGAENLLPWHTDWLSSAELGFPLVADQFHRDVHPLIRQYVCAQIRAGDQTLGPLLRFRGGSGNNHCEICDQGTERGLLLILIAISVNAHTMRTVLEI